MRMLGRQFRVSDAVVAAELGDEAVLLNVETGLYFGLGEAEVIVWHMLGDGASEDEIIGRLLDTYEVDASQLRVDLTQFLETLLERNLLQLTDS